eukprot:GHVR01186024.1.p1 GENE.GHVR01186024.1~~GHVR01186024.1.p1  ORF type:complete len:126 (+),score=17.69 GHVR01186024.1:94-471(+)
MTGTIDFKQLQYLLKCIGIQCNVNDLNALEDEYKQHGEFTFEDVTEITAGVFKDSKIRRDLLKGFKALDHDNTGRIKPQELKRVLNCLGLSIKLTTEEVDTFFIDAGIKFTGLVDYNNVIDYLLR